jgi:hypothetical protein
MPSKKRFATHTLVGAAMLASLTASTVFASGSISPGGGQGADTYSVGKSVFFKQVACDSCGYAGRGKDAADAKALLMTLKSADSKVKLDADDLAAVNSYLSKRYRLAEMAGK